MYNTKAAKIIDLTKNSNSVNEIRMSSCPKIVGRRYDFDFISTGNKINFDETKLQDFELNISVERIGSWIFAPNPLKGNWSKTNYERDKS